MEIINTKVYGLDESLIRSGYPMRVEPLEEELPIPFDNSCQRSIRLGNTPAGTGHDSFLKGILVESDWIAPQYIWPQFQRYHFADIISSQSKMHMIVRMMAVPDRSKYFCKYVDQRAIDLVVEKVKAYNDNPTADNFETIIANTPSGLELGAGITTNYLQLKTMYNQRKNHRLKFWNTVFKEWCEGLDMFMELTQGKE